MTAVLTVWVVLLTLVTAGNLTLCFAVIRRLKVTHTSHPSPMNVASPRVGAYLADFHSAPLSGVAHSALGLSDGPQQAVFLTPTCRACLTLVETLRTAHGDRSTGYRNFFLVADEPTEAATRNMASELARFGQVSIISLDDPAITAFGGITIFPTVIDLVDGKIAWVGQRLPAATAAAGR